MALQTLPPAAKAEDDAFMDCFVYVPELGRVWVTAHHIRHKDVPLDVSPLDGGRRAVYPPFG